MASFPTSVFAPATRTPGQTIGSAHVNDLQDEVVAIEDGYRNGSAPLNSSGSTVAALSVTGPSTFGGAVTFGSTSPHRGSLRSPSTRTGEIAVYPPDSTASTALGRVFLPDGSELNVSTSGTAGLQEAIAAASTTGADLRVIGGSDFGSTIGGAVVYHIGSTRTLSFPAMQGKCVRIGAATLNFAGSGSEPCVRFDSQMMMDFEMAGGQIVATGRIGDGVVFAPSAAVPLDNVTSITDSRFRFQSIALTSTLSTGAAVRLNSSQGGIDHNLFEFVELNGGVTGLRVDTPNSSHSVSNNQIGARHLHSQLVSTHPQIEFGQSTTVRVAENDCRVGVVSSNATNPCLRIWGVRNEIALAMNGTAPSTQGIRFEPSADGNRVVAARVLGGISDDSTSHTNRVLVGTPSIAAAITVGASPQTYTNRDAVAETLLITGGTMTAIALSADSTTFTTISSLATMIPLDVGETARFTFSSAPTLTRLMKGPTPGYAS